MITYRFAKPEEKNKVAKTISEVIRSDSNQIGWLTDDLSSIISEFDELGISFEKATALAVGEKITGVLIFRYQKERKTVRLLGPYIKGNNWEELANDLFVFLISEFGYETDRVIVAFPDINKNALKFAKRNGLSQYNAEMRMSLDLTNYSAVISKDIEVRELEKSEHDMFRTLHPDTVYLSADEIFERLDKNHRVFVILKDRDIVGYVYTEREGNNAEINFIRIVENERGNGAGSALLSYVLSWHKQNGAKSASLSVRPENLARKLFEKVGFKKEKLILAFDLITT